MRFFTAPLRMQRVQTLRGAIRAVGCRDMDRLQVGAECSAGNACHLGPDPTEVFCLTARGDLVAGDRLASAYFTGLSHPISSSGV